MIRISISVAAFEAIVGTLPLGTVRYEYEPELSPNGERLIWLEERWINKLDAIRMPGESACSRFSSRARLSPLDDLGRLRRPQPEILVAIRRHDSVN